MSYLSLNINVESVHCSPEQTVIVRTHGMSLNKTASYESQKITKIISSTNHITHKSYKLQIT